MRALVLAVVLLSSSAPSALARGPRLESPVPGDIARGFEYAGDPFARGHHRGIDFAARPGETVRAACSGRVVFAGRAGANGRVATLRCGRWNVTHLPLATLTTTTGAALAAGTPLGTAASTRDHPGLHLGVREATYSLGYIDPEPLLHTPPRPAPPAPRTTRPTPRTPPHPGPFPSAQRPAPAERRAHARAAPAGQHAPRPAPAPARPGSSPLAPWPAWAGLALLLCGAAGAGGRRARRKRRNPLGQASTAPVR